MPASIVGEIIDTSSRKRAFTGAQASSQAGLGFFLIVFEANLKEH